MPCLVTNLRKIAPFVALSCTCIIATLADVGVQTSTAPAIEERRLLIRSGTLFTKDGVPISLSGFDSEIQSDKPPQVGTPPGPKQIKDVIVRSGSAFVRVQDLGKLLQTHIKNDKLTDLAVQTSGSEIKISGHLKKAIPVHFEIKGPVSLTPDGLIDLHESSMKVDKLLMKGLSQMLGMDPGNVLGKDSHGGLHASKEDIVMDPSALWGMSVHGKLTQVKVVNHGLMLIYGNVPKVARRSTAKLASSGAGGK